MQDAEGHNLWDMTWHRAYGVSSGLTPALLVPSGVAVKPASPERGPELSQQPGQFPDPSSTAAGPSSPLATANAAYSPADPLPGLPQATPQATAAPTVPPLEAVAAAPQSEALPAAEDQTIGSATELPPLQQQGHALPQEGSEFQREPADIFAAPETDARISSAEAGEYSSLAGLISITLDS